MKVFFSDVTHPPASSSETLLGWMPSFPDWTTAETLWYPSPSREEKVSHISVTQKNTVGELTVQIKVTTGMNERAAKEGDM